MNERAERSFPDIAIQGIMNACGVKQWTHSPQEEWKTIVRVAREENWRVRCHEVGYTHFGTDRGYISLFTAAGDVRCYSTTEFARMVPASWARANAVADWKKLEEPRMIDPLILNFSLKIRQGDEGEYLMLEAVQPADELDKILNGG